MLGDITLGQYYPGNSFVHRLDPRTKILVTLLLIVAIFLAQSVPAYVALWVMVFFVIAISKLPFLLVFKSVKPLLFIILLTLAMHVFVGQGETVLYQWKFIRITQEGIAMGIKMSMRLMLLLMISSVLTFTTSPIVLTDGIESLLRPFRCIGVPAHELAMMMTISSIFLIIDGSPAALGKKTELWEYLRTASPRLFHRMKYRSFSIVSNFPGYQGRKLSVSLYRLARKIYKFN